MPTRALFLWLATLVLSACGTPPGPPASTPPSEIPPASPPRTADASGDPSHLDDLGAVAWWATELLGFGVIPEAPPDPDPAVQPGSFRQLTIGTLDGRVTAVLALHSEWAHSYVAGPYGTDVLVANDIGSTSEVFLISALDGTRTDLFSSPEIVAAAAMGDDGRSVYYAELSRDDATDQGLWRRAVGGGAPVQLLPGPLGDDNRDPRVWWVTADPLEDRVVVQSCFGQVRCTTTAVDPRTGETDEQIEFGWPLGADSTTFFAGGLGPSDGAYAWDLATGEAEYVRGGSDSVPVRVDGDWRFARGEAGVPEGATIVIDRGGAVARLPGADRAGSVLDPLSERRGVALPDGWVMRWPPIRIQQLAGAMGPPGDGQLIHIRSGRRIDLPRLEFAVPLATPCEVPVPSAMPNGQRPGFGVVELVDGVWTVRWGPTADAVVVAVNLAALGEPSELGGAAPVVVRGHPGQAVLIGDEGVGITAFTWTEKGCPYTVWLPAGTSLDETIRYSERY